MKKDVPLNYNRVIEVWLLHLRFHLGQNLSKFLLVPRALGHVAFAKLGAAGEDLRKVLGEGVLVQVVVEPGVGVVHDIFLAKLGGVGVVRPDGEGDDDDHDNEIRQKDKVAIVGVKQELREANTDGKTLLSVGISILFPIFLRGGVGEGLVRLGHHHEHRFGRGIIWVLIRVEFQTHLFVRLLYFFELGRGINIKNGKGIEGIYLPVGLDGEVKP
mmetsp:Transcript_15479/g.37123  ORF Transcript_15479/g.37123 Transcript_15479/m.37123 type:complete len:215 (+) Transcript_15479:1190-1834(+)